MKISQAFDELVSGYSEKISRWVPNYKLMLEGVFHFLPEDFKPQNALELGCGNGNLSSLFFHYFPTIPLTAIDISAEMLSTVEERLKGKPVNFQCCLIQEAQFPAGTFDLVVAALAIHHLNSEEKKQLFCEVHSWLRPGGFFCAADLYIEKSDLPLHDLHLKYWRSHSQLLGTDDEEWEFLMQHYAEFDKPDDWLAQLSWLKIAGFDKIETPFRKLGWTTVQARKAS